MMNLRRGLPSSLAKIVIGGSFKVSSNTLCRPFGVSLVIITEAHTGQLLLIVNV